ncbi:MAG: hypothetical protein ACOH19_15850 [Rhodoglobus sp.]
MPRRPSFFVDRGVGSRLIPEGLRAIGWEVVTMDERYGKQASQSIPDTQWIHDASALGEVVITKDRNVAKRPLEAQAIYMNETRVLVLASAHITGPESLDRLLTNQVRIEKLVDQPGPFVLGVHVDRLDRIHLNYP